MINKYTLSAMSDVLHLLIFTIHSDSLAIDTVLIESQPKSGFLSYLFLECSVTFKCDFYLI